MQPAAAASAAVATASAHLVSIRKANLVPSYPVGRAVHHDETARSADRGRDRRSGRRRARGPRPGRAGAVRVGRAARAGQGGARRRARRRARRSSSSSTNDDGMTHEAVVSLDERRLLDWRDVPGVQPAIHIDEFDDAGNAIVADPRFREALAKRGHRAPRAWCMVDPWSIGCFEDGDRRLARGARVAALRPRGRQRLRAARSAAWSASST